MDDRDDLPRPPPAGWLEAMDESDADLAAGRIVPGSVVFAELRASIVRMEARQAGANSEQPEAQGSKAQHRS